MVSFAYSEDAWLPEFEDLSGKTQDVGAFSKEELKALVARCEKLKPLIEQSDNPQKPVYLFRLEKCRKLFAYMLDLPDKK